MDRLGVTRILNSDLTVSDKIRALDAAGHPRAEIARLLGKRYQHVRNVLEADKLREPAPAEGATAAFGFDEPSQPFGAVHRLPVEAGGVVRLPADVLRALQARTGSVIIAELQADGLKLFDNVTAWERVRSRVRRLGIEPGRDLAGELIAERRAEGDGDD